MKELQALKSKEQQIDETTLHNFDEGLFEIKKLTKKAESYKICEIINSKNSKTS